MFFQSGNDAGNVIVTFPAYSVRGKKPQTDYLRFM